jgi:Cu+-exporting ATPase
MVTDPVCGMRIDAAKAAAKVDHGGKTYYFCSSECKESFLEDPEAFVVDDAEEDEDLD